MDEQIKQVRDILDKQNCVFFCKQYTKEYVIYAYYKHFLGNIGAKYKYNLESKNSSAKKVKKYDMNCSIDSFIYTEARDLVRRGFEVKEDIG